MIHMNVLVVGPLSYDHLIRVNQVPSAGECAIVLGESKYFGGRGANVAVGCARLGITTGLAGVVGHDSKSYKEYLVKNGVDVGQLQVSEETPTSRFTRYYDDTRTLSFYAPTTEPLYEDLVIDVKGVDHVHLSILGERSTPRLFEQLKEFSGSVSYGLGGEVQRTSPKTLELILGGVDYLFMNHDEAKRLRGVLGLPSMDATSYGPRAIVVTKGGEGSTVYTSDGKSHVPAVPPREYRSSLGAGDAYIAGFLFGVSMGKNPLECGTFGSRVATRSLESIGAQESLPSRDAL